jgi:hypothetical protein
MATQKLNLLPTALEIDPLYFFPASNQGKTYKVSVDLLSSWIHSKDIRTKTSDYTITNGDKKSTITFTNTGSSTLLVPKNSDQAIPIGTIIDISNYNTTGSVNVAGDSGVSVNSALGSYVKNFGIASLTKIDTDSWILSGNLSLYQDSYFEQTKLLLRMTGDDNGTTFIDSSLYNRTVTANNGTKTVTSTSKFNDSSAKFDYSSLFIPDSDDFDFHNEDFTIEFWLYLNSNGVVDGTNYFLFSSNNLGSNFVFKSNSTNYSLVLDFTTELSSTISPILNSWHHLALVRHHGRLLIFINGEKKGESIISPTRDFSNTLALIIGSMNPINDENQGYLDGYMNDFRITKGKARYTINFTPPSEHLYKNQNIINDPSTVPGLKLWLDASDSSTLYDSVSGGSLVSADSPVLRWTDKSSNGLMAIQANATYAPLRKTSIVNNKDCLLFDGTNDYIDVNSISVHQTITAFVVWKPTNDTCYAFDSTSSSNGVLDRVTYSNVSGPYVYAGADLRTRNNDNKLINNWTISSIVFDHGSTKCYIDSILNASGNAGSNNMSSFRIGSKYSLENYLNGYVGEILLYDSSVSDSERIAIEGGLKIKWGIIS